MLPKLLDVPISTYLMVLAKIRRPSTTPSASTSRSFSSRITSAASLATSVAESTEIPTSAACRASASLTPSPRNATSPPVQALDPHDPGLVFGADPGEHGRGGDRRGELRRRRGRRGRCRSASGPRGSPRSLADLGGDHRVVAGDDLDGDARGRPGGPARRRRRVWVGRGRPAARRSAGRVRRPAVSVRQAGGGSGGDGDDPVAGGELGVQRGLRGCRHVDAASAARVSGAPLVTSVCAPAGVADQDGDHLPFVVERQHRHRVVAVDRGPLRWPRPATATAPRRAGCRRPPCRPVTAASVASRPQRSDRVRSWSGRPARRA